MLTSLERFSDRVDLSIKAVDELGSVAATDEQLRLGSPPTADPYRTFEVLAVDHEHASRCDRDVVDIAPTPRHASVVQRDRGPPGGPLLDRGGHGLLSLLAAAKRDFVLRRLAQREQETADVWVRLTGAPLPTRATALVLAGETPARQTHIQRLRVDRVRGWW